MFLESSKQLNEHNSKLKADYKKLQDENAELSKKLQDAIDSLAKASESSAMVEIFR